MILSKFLFYLLLICYSYTFNNWRYFGGLGGLFGTTCGGIIYHKKANHIVVIGCGQGGDLAYNISGTKGMTKGKFVEAKSYRYMASSDTVLADPNDYHENNKPYTAEFDYHVRMFYHDLLEVGVHIGGSPMNGDIWFMNDDLYYKKIYGGRRSDVSWANQELDYFKCNETLEGQWVDINEVYPVEIKKYAAAYDSKNGIYYQFGGILNILPSETYGCSMFAWNVMENKFMLAAGGDPRSPRSECKWNGNNVDVDYHPENCPPSQSLNPDGHKESVSFFDWKTGLYYLIPSTNIMDPWIFNTTSRLWKMLITPRNDYCCEAVPKYNSTYPESSYIAQRNYFANAVDVEMRRFYVVGGYTSSLCCGATSSFVSDIWYFSLDNLNFIPVNYYEDKEYYVPGAWDPELLDGECEGLLMHGRNYSCYNDPEQLDDFQSGVIINHKLVVYLKTARLWVFYDVCDECICNGIISSNESFVCTNGRGSCVDEDFCSCYDGYSGKYCQCSNEIDCNNHGMCNSFSINFECECFGDYTGINCDTFGCFGIAENLPNSCRMGTCISNNDCECTSDYYGYQCQERIEAIATLTQDLRQVTVKYEIERNLTDLIVTNRFGDFNLGGYFPCCYIVENCVALGIVEEVSCKFDLDNHHFIIEGEPQNHFLLSAENIIITPISNEYGVNDRVNVRLELDVEEITRTIYLSKNKKQLQIFNPISSNTLPEELRFPETFDCESFILNNLGTQSSCFYSKQYYNQDKEDLMMDYLYVNIGDDYDIKETFPLSILILPVFGVANIYNCTVI